MLETLLVLAALVAVGVAGALVSVPAATLVALGGMAILAVGIALAVPTGLWYHVVLHRLVSPRAPLPRTWWLSPARLHRHLTEEERRRLAGWYRAGGVGFALCLAGGLAAIASLLVSW